MPVPMDWKQAARLRFQHVASMRGEAFTTPMGQFKSGTTTWAAMNSQDAVHLTWEWVVSSDDDLRMDLRDPLAVRSNLRLYDSGPNGTVYLDRLRASIVMTRILVSMDWQESVLRALSANR